MSVPSFHPDANYLARTNIVHPRSSNAAVIAAAEANARAEIQTRHGGLVITGGSISKER